MAADFRSPRAEPTKLAQGDRQLLLQLGVVANQDAHRLLVCEVDLHTETLVPLFRAAAMEANDGLASVQLLRGPGHVGRKVACTTITTARVSCELARTSVCFACTAD